MGVWVRGHHAANFSHISIDAQENFPSFDTNVARESRLADPPWKTQSGPNPLLDQKWTTGGDRGRNFEQILWTKIS